MSSATGQVDKTCPKCAAQGEVIKATAAQRELIVIDLRCAKCAHKWSLNLSSHNG